jgi:uncharacterized OsmC-like protein
MIIHLHGATDLERSDMAEPGLHVHGDAEGEGFGPLQMLAASLVLCTASVLESYARGVLQSDARDISVRVRWEYADKPYRVGRMDVTVRWPGLAEDRIEAAQRAVQSCTVHRTLEHPPALATEVLR